MSDFFRKMFMTAEEAAVSNSVSKALHVAELRLNAAMQEFQAACVARVGLDLATTKCEVCMTAYLEAYQAKVAVELAGAP